MSKFVKIRTELRDATMIRRALEDLKIEWQEDATYVHAWSSTKAQVPFLIEAPGAKFGLREDSEGVFEVVGDDMQMRAVRAVVERVQQRYAYHTVLAETQKAGFTLVEERTGGDQVIRLTVRRWS